MFCNILLFKLFKNLDIYSIIQIQTAMKILLVIDKIYSHLDLLLLGYVYIFQGVIWYLQHKVLNVISCYPL